MNRKNIRFFIPLLGLLLLFWVVDRFVLQQESPSAETAASGLLSVSFIDVGQGDAALILFPSGQTMLIDGGDADHGDTVVSFLREKGVTHLNYLIATHPHNDHIGGLPAVLKAFSVGQVFMPRSEHTTRTYERLLQALADKGLKVQTARAGVSVLEENGLSAMILGPISIEYESLNNYSTVLKIEFGQTSFLFLGDAEKESEAELTERYGQALAADVVKAGHHGSRTSSTKELIEATKAAHVVFSLGKDNEYGHPHQTVWDAWAKTGAALYRTDESGTVSFVSDGSSLSVAIEHP